MMKILHINCNYLTTVLHKTMIKHLDNEIVSNTVFVPTLFSSNIEVDDSDVVVGKCFNKIDRFFYFLKQRKILNSIELNIRNISEYNCIHAYTLFTDGNVAMNLSNKYGIPYIVTVRDTDINIFLKYKKYLIPIALRILNNASAIIFLSNTYKNYFIDKYVPETNRKSIAIKSYIIPNGIDDFWHKNNYYKNRKLNDKKCLRVIFVGKINNRKNVSTTLKGLELLRKENFDIKFTVIGKVENLREYKKIINDSNTTYLDAMNMENLLKYYRDNDIFVMASHRETFGLVYAEALSQGLPVVYTKGQGFDGQFDEGVVGYHVSDKKPMDIANAIKKIVKNYDELSANASKNSNIFDWNLIVKSYIKLYKRIIGG